MIDIFDQGINTTINTTVTVNTCSICLDNLCDDNTKYKLDSCGHEFHSNCLLNWYKNRHDCPLCRNAPENNPADENKLKLLIQYARRKTANKSIVNLVNKYKNTKKAITQNKKDIFEFRKNNKEYFKLKKQLRKLNNTKWTNCRKLRRLRNSIECIPILPLKI